MNLKIITNTDDFFSLQHQWQQLVVDTPHLSFSSYWEWLSLWWEIFINQDNQLFVICIERQQQLIAIAPFYIKDHSLYFIGTGEPEYEEVASEYLDIICKQQDSDLCANMIAEVLTNEECIHHCYFYNFLSNSTIAKTCHKLYDHFMQRTLLTGHRYLHNLSEPISSSKTLQRYLKKFNRLGGEIKSTKSHDELLKHWNSLTKLHQKRWQHQSKAGVFSAEKFVRFHKRFSEQALKDNYLELFVMTVGDETIAAFYGFRHQKTISFYQGGFDQTFSPNISPGKLMHFLLMLHFREKGMECYDFMKGATEKSYKQQLSNKCEPMFNATLHRKNIINLRYKLKWILHSLRDLFK